MMNKSELLNFEILPGARKFLKSIKNDKALQGKFQSAIESLRLDPTLGESKKGDLAGISSLDIRHNKTNYELAYRVKRLENGDLLLIILAGTRENFYEDLKNYMKFSSRIKD
ncbi:type II toxin-antitoxin system RelE/ParE family toxin [Sporosarcina sp. FSL K6-3457]|uniref:type II toxin-antitoxin system RelE/ParE family toxin n=1 Tax=Sporosarcina sp. FSL K6-3457 TaxID=2978204 RepID=UPI0030F59546